MFECIVTGRKITGDLGEGGDRNAQADGTSLYRVDIEDKPNLFSMFHRLTLTPSK